MPQRPGPEDAEYSSPEQVQRKGSLWFPLWGSWRAKKVDAGFPTPISPPAQDLPLPEPSKTQPETPPPTFQKSIALGPRKPTFQRLESERRDRLCPLDACRHDARASSRCRRKRAVSASLDVRSKTPIPQGSFPDLRDLNNSANSTGGSTKQIQNLQVNGAPGDSQNGFVRGMYSSDAQSRTLGDTEEETAPDLESQTDTLNDSTFRAKLEAQWILNLSMHFRDGSDREKFFVTYIEQPNRWRRVTVSCDYRWASEHSLESDLKSLRYQRDKNARIYQAIRDSLPDIQFYDTVTNLKLETNDGRLHVHVTEDANEVINYPAIGSIDHLNFGRNGYHEIRESDLAFESHLSGFVYRVSTDGNTYIKKEISSPDTVDEFLYELNALAALRHSQGIIGLVGVVVDDDRTWIKGLLIEWASRGSLNDFLFEHQDRPVPWPRRAKWARQILAGMADIHEAGFIQGDCTISNVVLDENDDAKIVDINRRGCPIGWEPPEFEGIIRSAQRVSLFIGVKSDLFQLGMILWAIAKQADEPEREERPLPLEPLEVPEYYKRVLRSCLAESPSERLPANQLLKHFPASDVLAADSTANLESPIPLATPLWTSTLDSADLHPDTPKTPNYMLQDSLLAGIGRPFDNAASIKTSETPLESEAALAGHPTDGSGLVISLTDDTSKTTHSGDIDQAKQGENAAYGSSNASAGARVAPRVPVHQDSGFHDSTWTDLQDRGVAMPSFTPATRGQSGNEVDGDTGFSRETGDLLRGMGAHTGAGHESSGIPRSESPSHLP